MAQYTDSNGQSNEGRYYIVSAPEIHVIASDGSEVKVLLETDTPPGPGENIDIEDVSTETDEVIVSPCKVALASTPETDSEAYFFGNYTQSVHLGPGDIVGGGHNVGVVGNAINNSTSDISMSVGVEGRVDQLNSGGTITDTKAVLGLVVNQAGTMTNAVGLASEINNVGTITNAVGVKAGLTGQAGTVTKYTGVQVPDMTGLTVGSKVGIEILDPLAPIVSKAAIVEQSYSYSQPTTGQTLNVPNGITDWSIVPAGTLAAFTVNFPTNPIDGQNFVFSTTQTVTSLTLGGGSNTIMNPVTTLAAGGTIEYKFYGQGINLWVRKR